jgi:hypothetical protein
MRLTDEALDRLRAAGLYVSERFVDDHLAFPGGVVVGKPVELPGNGIAGYVSGFANHGDVDAPTMFLHAEAGAVVVTVAEYAPGPGPGDFEHRHPTLDAALDDVLDYLVRVPERMAAFRAGLARRG